MPRRLFAVRNDALECLLKQLDTFCSSSDVHEGLQN